MSLFSNLYIEFLSSVILFFNSNVFPPKEIAGKTLEPYWPTLYHRVQGVMEKVLQTRYQVPWVHYLRRRRALKHEIKLTICSIPQPNTKKGGCKFLGAARFCQIWIPSVSDIANPLYEATDLEPQSRKRPSGLGFQTRKVFQRNKDTRVTALGLLDMTQDFKLFIHEMNHIALGVFTQLGHSNTQLHNFISLVLFMFSFCYISYFVLVLFS